MQDDCHSHSSQETKKDSGHQHHLHDRHVMEEHGPGCSLHPKEKIDWFLWGSSIVLFISYMAHVLFAVQIGMLPYLPTFITSSYELLNTMSWGIALGIIFVGLLDKVPREFVISLLGKGGTFNGILRATGAGVLLDLCSHGILMVGMKLYERGASLGQLMAFLIASPWNSLSLTLILWALVGFKWMMTFLLLSMLIAVISGLVFESLVRRGVLPANPNKTNLPENFQFWEEAKEKIRKTKLSGSFFGRIFTEGFRGSKMVLRWIFFGVILAATIRTFLPPESLQTFFGPTLAGLGLTVVFATILEVCSEGSTPIAADLLTRAAAGGNAFAFLMTGVSTDYTEIATLKETTGSWKIAFFLPLVTLPQVLILAWMLNQI